MVGSNSRQFRVRYLNAGYFDSGVNEDMIDAGEWKASKKSFFRAMAGQLDLGITKKRAEPAPHTRRGQRVEVAT